MEVVPMKRQYIAAVACLMAGAIGFVGAYSSQRADSKKQEITKPIERPARISRIAETSNTIEPKKPVEKPVIKEEKKETKAPKKPKVQVSQQKEEVEVLHFSFKNTASPLKGEVLLPYSMDRRVYFPTLDQYKHNSAVVIKANEDDKVCFFAKGNITNIENNEETGCTVTEDLGDGYTAIYGQLKDLTVKVGDSVECGSIAGYINKPTKYYSVEGSNLYFQLLKDGTPVDPTEYIRK